MVQLNRRDPRRPGSGPHHVSARRSRNMLTGPLAAVCAGFLLIGGAAFAAGDVPSTPPPIPAAQSDQELGALLLRIEQQISDGHTFAPADDNALNIWPQVVRRALPASPESRQTLEDFVTRVRVRAAGEKAAGSNDVAVDLTLFQDLATALLAGANDAPDSAAASNTGTAVTQPPAEDHAAPGAAAPGAIAPGAVAPGTVAAVTTTADHGEAAAPDATARPPGPPNPPAATDTQPAQGRDVAAADTSQPQREAQREARREAAMNAEPQAAAAGRTDLAIADQPTRAPAAPDQSLAAICVKRGDAMLAIKDISAARKFYEFGANAGSARAATALAETYDPAWLGKLGAVGIRPDPALAEHWYRSAAALGDPDAGARLHALTTQAAK